MTKNYRFSLFHPYRLLSDDRISVGCVLDLKTKKPVLFLDVIKGLLEKTKQTCCLVGEQEADNLPGEFYAMIWVDARTFVEEIENDKKGGPGKQMNLVFPSRNYVITRFYQ